MNRKVLEAIALGVGGLVVALVLTLGAFALAGQDISQPADVPMFTAPASPSPSHDGDDQTGGSGLSSGPGSEADDHGGSDGSDDGASVSSGSGSGSGSSEGSGSGSGEDSGSGSGDDSDSGEHEDD